MAGFVKGFNPVRISGSAEWAGSSVWYADEFGQAEECPVCKPVDGLDSGRPRVQIPPGPPNYQVQTILNARLQCNAYGSAVSEVRI